MDFITEIVKDYGIIAVFILIFLEYACFPLPSEIVLPFSGAVATQSDWSFVAILFLSIFAGVLGSLVCYAIGYFGGKPLINKFVKRFPKMEKGLVASQEKFDKYAILSVGIGRLIPLCRTYISFIAGISRQNILPYIISTTIGITIWNFILVGLGYIFSDNWRTAVYYYNEYSVIIILIVIVILAIFVFIKARKKNKKISKK